MKRKSLFLCIFTAFVLGLSVPIPALATIPPTPWGTLPLSDSVDDVCHYTTAPSSGDYGDYRDEIDIKSVYIDATDGVHLFIEFCALPIESVDYNYTIYFNTDGDDDAEYLLYTYGMGLPVLERLYDGYLWNGSDFSSDNSVFYTTDINDTTLSIEDIDEPIPTYQSMQVSVIVIYTGESPTLYLDYAPNPGGAPGSLLFLIILLSLVGVGIALVIIYFRRKAKLT